MPESHWDAEKGAFKDTFGAHYSEMSAARQAEADRVAALPKTPDEYKLDLPADLKIPDGMKREDISIDTKNPLFKTFQTFAHENKLAPETAQGLLGLYVQQQLSEQSAISARVAEEAKKLGPNHATRVSAVKTALTAQVGAAHAEALAGENALWTASQVQALEALIAKISGQGGASPPANGGAGDPPQNVPLTAKLWPKRQNVA